MRQNLRKRDGKARRAGAILIAIDFSPASRRSLKQALSMAAASSRLILVHVVSPAQSEGFDLEREIGNARQKLKQFCETEGITARELITLEVRDGAPFREILDCARQYSAEMIVLGVDGTSALGGVALGHTADRVSRYATCPVLLVRDGDIDAASPKERSV